MEDSLGLFQQLPDSILLQVFSFLDGTSLVRASSVCQQWYCVANDDVLWRHLVFRMVRKHVILPRDKGSWRGEYKRLTYHVPSELSQDVSGHNDEIYYVTFSPSGKFLASVGKDGTCRLWKYGNTITLQNTAGPFFNPPLKTRFCEFNESETLLMVTGLTHIFDVEGSIFIAVLSVPDLNHLYAVKGEYPNFRGGWLNDTSILLPQHFYHHGNGFKLEAHEVNVKSKKRDTCLADQFVKCRNKGRDLLVTYSNQSRCDFARVIDPRQWGNLGQYFDLAEETASDMEACGSDFSQAREDQTKQEPAICKSDTVMSGSDSDSDTDELDFLKKKPESDDDDDDDDDDEFAFDDSSTNGDTDSEFYDLDELEDYALYQKMVRTARKMADHGQQNKTGKQQGMTIERSRPHTEVLQEILSHGKKIILMVHSSRRLEEKCFIALYAVKEDEANPGKPFKRLGVNGGILGLRISHDQRYLVYAVRELKETNNYWGFDTDILTIVYDLILDQCQENIYMGSTATATDHLSYIFPDLSQDLVAMGAEVVEGHLWDRHYGVKLQCSIAHQGTGQQGSGLNAVAFHPQDQETLVTAGDDRLLKVWRSKNRQAEISRGEESKMEVKENDEDEESSEKYPETKRKKCSKHNNLFSCFSRGSVRK